VTTGVSTVVPGRRGEYLGWVVAVVVAAIAVTALYFRPTIIPATEVRLDIVTPTVDTPRPDNFYDLAISPDGGKVVFSTFVDGKPQLWLRTIESGQSRLLEGTEGAWLPFWSPNSTSIGFWNGHDPTQGEQPAIKRVDLAGGTSRTMVVANFF